jgi:hypothetical protein
MQEGGAHSVEWSGHSLPAGIYFQRLTLGNQEISQKMLLMK